MLEKAIESIKKVFGHKSRKEAEIDEAVLAVLKVIADSRLYLVNHTPDELDAGKMKELAHAWSEAGVKVNRLDGKMGQHCLVLAKTFSGTSLRDPDAVHTELEQVEAIYDSAREFLREGRIPG